MFTPLYAQQAQTKAPSASGKGAATGGGLGMMWPMLAIFVVMYFMLIRPQQKKQKQLEKKRNELKKGDRIVTNGGICGKVSHIKEAGAVVVVDVGSGVKLEIVKSAVAQVIPPGEEKSE
jgi:preprotein translocase subunit YajC